MSRFTGRVVLVTGASRGLGRAIALAFAGEGAAVALGYRSREHEAREALTAVEAAGARALALPFDVTDADAVRAAVELTRERLGPVDVLVNNAGVMRSAPLALMSEADFDQVVDTSLRGAFLCTRAVVKGMMARRTGTVINVSSVAAVRASPAQTNYATAKGGLLALTRSLAAELGPHGVRVNAVMPGYLDTGMATRIDQRLMAERVARSPLGRVGRAEEVARVVLFLASDEASYVVGQAITVDGGLSL